MKTLLLMISFLTRLPVPQIAYTEERYQKGIKLMPVVGLLLGGCLYGVSFIHLLFSPLATAFVLLICYIALTGGLHLDGLADTCDGVFSGRERERKLAIMRDSFIGTFGVLALIAACLAYLVFFTELARLQVPYTTLILLPVIGKAAPILSATRADYVRATGLGKIVADHCSLPEIAAALFVTVITAIFIQPLLCLPAAALAFASVLLITMWLKKSLGGITGDTLGMVCELAQIIFLISLCCLQSILKLL